jgi:hypothetical protein
VATWAVLTGRKLVSGAYDDWRRAWLTDDDEVPAGLKIFVLRKAGDPDEVISFGMFDGSQEDLESMRPEQTAEDAREQRMAPFVASVFADGVYEVVEQIET